MRQVHLTVPGRFVITIDRGSGLVTVREHRRRKRFELPLAYLAQHTITSVAQTEARAKKAARRKS